MAGFHTGPGIMPVHTNQVGKPHASKTMVREHRGSYFSVGDKDAFDKHCCGHT